MVESKKEVVKKAPDIDRDRDDSEGNDPQIPADLTDAESFLFILPQEKDKVCIKVDAEQDHENRDDGLLKNRIAGNTVAENAETSGAGGAEAQAETVKKRHARDEEQYDLCDGHTEVDHIEDHGGVADLGNKLSHDRARALRPHHMHLTAHSPLTHGHYGEDKDDDAHTADPVGKASPEEAGMAERFNICQDTGSCGRKTGNRLEKRI